MTGVATSAPTVLIIDDEMGILDTIRILLKNEGFIPYTALGGKKGLEQIAALKPELIITDVRMPDVTGLDILASVRAHDPEAVVILMTAQASLQSAIGAVNNGAFYYIQKPFKNEELVTIVRRAAEHRNLRRESKGLKADTKRRDRSGRPIGASKPWLDALHVAESVAVTDSTVLLQGESGTGKEVVAHYIHDLSPRAAKPFLSINCGALPESLLESELFGHVKGSFTGASRDKEGLFFAA
ncbi:MAG TPA: sigma 54-interacting transcriptional regulator, partial [Gemmatimonadaceae bacterium]|nr:sigma 54-interacting transcriptional regulator [Gemmatimonadaceae bacterium]